MNSTAILAIACGVYLVVIVVTNRGFIIAPRYRMLLAQALDCRARAAVLAARGGLSEPAARAEQTIQDDLTTVLDIGVGSVWLAPVRWLSRSPLTKIAAHQITINSAQRRLVDLVADDNLAAYGAAILTRDGLDSAAVKAVADALAAMPADARRVTIAERQRSADAAAEQTMMDQFDRERVALWLAIVGLIVAFAAGFFLDHELTMLVGALGGFIAPVVSALNRDRNTSFWGVMVLSPVGGALTAVGGLLLVYFLAKTGILGPIFLDGSWNAPNSEVALTLALLFGFSGRLFSQLAISATSQITNPVPVGAARGG